MAICLIEQNKLSLVVDEIFLNSFERRVYLIDIKVDKGDVMAVIHIEITFGRLV